MNIDVETKFLVYRDQERYRILLLAVDNKYSITIMFDNALSGKD